MIADTMKKKPSSKRVGPRASAATDSGTMQGNDILVRALERAGVDTIFAYPGGASLELHQALTRSKSIRVILPRHEQGGVFAAEGYARATGRAGVCMATSGPGATNLVTGIADAYLDSTPLVAITGQVPQSMIGKGAFQETDIFGMTLPVVKHSYLVTDVNDIPRIVQEAFHIAQTGRPGPVVIDVPKNVQQMRTVPVFPETVRLRGYDPEPHVDDAVLGEILDRLERSERPVLYVGGGIISSGAAGELRAFAEAAQIPVTTTLMGIGAFPDEHPLSLRWLGMHGAAFANWAVSGELKRERLSDGSEQMVKVAAGADLLLAFGVRFDDRVTGNVQKFCEGGVIVHVDIDASELNKNKKATLPVVSDIRYALRRLNEMYRKRSKGQPRAAWLNQVAAWKERAPFRYRVNDEVLKSLHMQEHMGGRADQVILPQMAVEALHELTGGDAIVTTGVGQHQMWAGQFYKFKHPRQMITSAGLGSMGFGFPAALGAKVACPDRQVVDIDGDGSFLMNIQELATAHIENIAAKEMILNNQHLGMVVQWEDRFYQGNRGNTYLGDPRNVGEIYPDFVRIANSFNVPAERVMFRKDLRAAVQRMLDSKEAYVLDVVTPYTEHVLPFIPAGRTVAEMIYE